SAASSESFTSSPRFQLSSNPPPPAPPRTPTHNNTTKLPTVHPHPHPHQRRQSLPSVYSNAGATNGERMLVMGPKPSAAKTTTLRTNQQDRDRFMSNATQVLPAELARDDLRAALVVPRG